MCAPFLHETAICFHLAVLKIIRHRFWYEIRCLNFCKTVFWYHITVSRIFRTIKWKQFTALNIKNINICNQVLIFLMHETANWYQKAVSCIFT